MFPSSFGGCSKLNKLHWRKNNARSAKTNKELLETSWIHIPHSFTWTFKTYSWLKKLSTRFQVNQKVEWKDWCKVTPMQWYLKWILLKITKFLWHCVMPDKLSSTWSVHCKLCFFFTANLNSNPFYGCQHICITRKFTWRKLSLASLQRFALEDNANARQILFLSPFTYSNTFRSSSVLFIFDPSLFNISNSMHAFGAL